VNYGEESHRIVILSLAWTTAKNLITESPSKCRFSTKRRRSFSVSRRQLQDDGMSVGQLIKIQQTKPSFWAKRESRRRISSPRHSEPNVNHGEESHRFVILRWTRITPKNLSAGLF